MSSKGAKSARSKLPKALADERDKIDVTLKQPEHVRTPEYHGHYESLGIDNSFSLETWKSGFSLDIKHLDDNDIEFHIKGIEAPIANALRRILLNHVPTVAIENVFISKNDSPIADELLAHRLGLIPIRVDSRNFDYRKSESFTDIDTVVFKLNVSCPDTPKSKGAGAPSQTTQLKVYSSDLIWEPQGDQAETYRDNPIAPAFLDIPITILRANQSLELICYCEKGIGKEHAKWSPVATAYYNLMPVITLKEPIHGALAKKLVDTCPMKVFDIENAEAVVARPESCTMCRECIRNPEWEQKIRLQLDKNCFRFYVQSAGNMPVKVIVQEGFRVLLQKIEAIQTAAMKLRTPKMDVN